MFLPELSHPPPGLRDRDVADHGAGRPHRLRPPDGARVPQDRRAGGHRRDHLSRAPRPRSSRARSPRSLEESLAGIEGIDYMSSISRPEQSQITVRFRLDARPRRRGQRRARPRRARARPAARRDRRAGHRQGRGRRPADHLPRRSRPTATRRWRSPTSPTASSRTGCRTCPASPTCGSSASAATRCASGSTARGSPPTG